MLAGVALAIRCGGDDEGGDGGPSCEIDLVVSPVSPVRGQQVAVTAQTTVDGLSGARSYSWSVSYGGQPVEFQVTSPDDQIAFATPEAGIYEIRVTGSVGGTPCSGASRDLNVLVPGARFEDYAVRVVPRDPLDAPAQEILIEVPGGANYSIGTLTVSRGSSAAGVLLGAAGTPLAGYLRAAPALVGPSPLPYTEGFAGADGAFELRLLAVTHDVLIVPELDSTPPALLAGVAPGALDGEVALGGGIQVTGTVMDGSDWVVGARVSLVVAGVPSTVATTAANGSFALRARVGGPVSVTVTPVPGSGLPQLELAPAAGSSVAGDSQIAISYAGAPDAQVSPTVRLRDGATPAAGARVTWIMQPVASAGTVTIGGTMHPARGVLRHTAQADGSGELAAELLPQAVYEVVIEPGPGAPAGESVRLVELVDLGAGAPSSFQLAAPAELTGKVVADGEPVAGARVAAVPRGVLAGVASAGDTATSDAGGVFRLDVAGAGAFELSVDGRAAGRARATLAETSPVPGGSKSVGDVALGPTLRLSGDLALPGIGPLAGASLQLLCLDCGPDDGPRVVAEAMSDAAGNFLLLAPDPGTDQ
jgi:hypothetical protein